MSNPRISGEFWRGKRVFVTGHTGFKGSWLSMWLRAIGAEVYGYALPPNTTPALFHQAEVATDLRQNFEGDIRDRDCLRQAIESVKPEIVFHLAAQPLVLDSYRSPLETYEVNVMGTAYLLDLCRQLESVRAIVVITTDKVYENRSWHWGYRENDRLGGEDPYSSSKACCEHVVSAYRRSFFACSEGLCGRVGLATARAGNVIGGGDWSRHRLVPDFLRAAAQETPLIIRNPDATRPWQHVLEPLSGYLLLGQALLERPADFSEAWNFAPQADSVTTVQSVVRMLNSQLEKPVPIESSDIVIEHQEQKLLNLDCSRAMQKLFWRPRWRLEESLKRVIDFWSESRRTGQSRSICLRQIDEYSNAMHGIERV